MMKDWRKYLAEMLGTSVLVGLGCGTAVIVGLATAVTGGAGSAAWIVAVALAFGLAVMAMVYAIGSVSGAHLNPAVSLALAIRKKLSWKDFCFYVISQFIGAIGGASLLFMVLKLFGMGSVTGLMGTNSYSGGVLATLEPWRQILIALIIEIVLTFIFVFTILGVTRKSQNKAVAGIVIGLTLALVHIIGISFTGTSVNPARSFGPAVFGGGAALKEVWLFIVAPLIGGALAAFMAWGLFKKDEEEKEVSDAKPAREITEAAATTHAAAPKAAPKKK